MGRICVVVLLSILTTNTFAISYADAIGYPERGIISDSVNQGSNKQSDSLVNSEITRIKEPDHTISSKSTTQLGFGTKLSHVSIDDDLGQTESVVSAQALSIFFTNHFMKDTRYLSEVHISNYAFEADTSHIGQEVSQLGIRFSVQKQKTFFQNFSPLFGVGVELSNTSYNKRHTVDSDGFLVNQFDSTSKINLGILFNMIKKWSINSEIDLAIKLEYSLPVAQAINRVSLGFIIFFQPIL